MRILGIDPGFAIIGYGVIEKDNRGKCSVVEFGALNTPSELSFPARLLKIDATIHEIINRFKPDAVAVEELFFNKNITTAIPVAEARGVIVAAAAKVCSDLFEYTPAQIKLAITGSGKADKFQVQQMTKMLLKLNQIPKPDDAADALAVALCHAQTNNKISCNSMFEKLPRGAQTTNKLLKEILAKSSRNKQAQKKRENVLEPCRTQSRGLK